MAGKRSDLSDESTTGPAALEHELMIHLEQAHELGERARRSTGALQEQLERAQEVVKGLRDRFGRTRE